MNFKDCKKKQNMLIFISRSCTELRKTTISIHPFKTQTPPHTHIQYTQYTRNDLLQSDVVEGLLDWD